MSHNDETAVGGTGAPALNQTMGEGPQAGPKVTIKKKLK